MRKQLLSWLVLIIGHLFMLCLLTSFVGFITELLVNSMRSIFEGFASIVITSILFLPALLLLFSYSTDLIVTYSQDILPSKKGVRYIVSSLIFVFFYVYLFLFSGIYFDNPIPSLICMILFAFLIGVTGYKQSK